VTVTTVGVTPPRECPVAGGKTAGLSLGRRPCAGPSSWLRHPHLNPRQVGGASGSVETPHQAQDKRTLARASHRLYAIPIGERGSAAKLQSVLGRTLTGDSAAPRNCTRGWRNRYRVGSSSSRINVAPSASIAALSSPGSRGAHGGTWVSAPAENGYVRNGRVVPPRLTPGLPVPAAFSDHRRRFLSFGCLAFSTVLKLLAGRRRGDFVNGLGSLRRIVDGWGREDPRSHRRR